MRILVLGAGVIGVTSAYYLARSGHEVTVVDRQPGPALETSFANAGQISPGYSAPWAAPGIPLKALQWLFQRHSPLSSSRRNRSGSFDGRRRCCRTARPHRYNINKSRMVRLAEYSRDCLQALRASEGIGYEGRQQGTLQVFRTQKQYDSAAKDIAVLKECGVPYQLLDRDGCAGAEPALASVKEKLVGGLRLPGDETGDCQIFTTRLATLAEHAGVRFRWVVRSTLVTAAGRITGVRSNGELLVADQYVVALGSYSRPLLESAELNVPIYPVKGFSLTVPIRNHAAAPISTVMDETYKIAVTRFDDRIRVGGMAELSGFDLRLNPRRRATLAMVVSDLFPGAGDVSKATLWTGLRPMTPDGTPVLGGTRYPNLWLNTGHGTLGWTMACGSAQVLADLVCQRKPAIRVDDLHVGRYGASGPVPDRLASRSSGSVSTPA